MPKTSGSNRGIPLRTPLLPVEPLFGVPGVGLLGLVWAVAMSCLQLSQCRWVAYYSTMLFHLGFANGARHQAMLLSCVLQGQHEGGFSGTARPAKCSRYGTGRRPI